MLAEQRHNLILDLVDKEGSVTIQDLKSKLGISEATARRDIVTLDKEGKLEKVFGGAIAIRDEMIKPEPTFAQKEDVHIEEKAKIAEYAMKLIEPSDMVFIDAGTTTFALVKIIPPSEGIMFVTNGVAHAQILAKNGNKVILIGGELKNSTEAVVGGTAIRMLQQFNFSKGFFGVNGINKRVGLTTPDYREALLKEEAIARSQNAYILADSSKFDVSTYVTFGTITDAKIITEKIPEAYKDYSNIIGVQ